jgi:hypothetical protein
MRVLNLVIEDRSDIKVKKIWVESFRVEDAVENPENALRTAVNEFLKSGSEESKEAIAYACNCFNWGDAMSAIPEAMYEKHGLTRLNGNSIDVFVDHDEVLCD